MFETVHLNVRTDADGHLRFDLPLNLPPQSEVTVSVATRPIFDRAEWAAHVDRIAGSIPDLEAPERTLPRAVEPLDDDADWQAHIDSVVGSLPEIERPVQPPLRAVEPL